MWHFWSEIPTLPKSQVDATVATTEIAPTILGVLGLDRDELEAVRMENTRPLPGFDSASAARADE